MNVINTRAMHTVEIYNGKLYLSGLVYETYFKNIQSVVFLNREGNIYLLPVNQAGASGLLLKIINARGDRVINATQQLRAAGIDNTIKKTARVKWDAGIAGLKICIGRGAEGAGL